MDAIKNLLKGLSSEPISTPENACPYCGCKIDCATGDGTPEPNSIDSVSLCLKCQHVLLFNDDLTVRKPTDKELADLKAAPHWAEIEAVIQSIKKVNESFVPRN